MDINWYPGHMAKTKRLIKENINLIDIIYEIIDARIPYSSKIKDIDDLIKDKPKLLIMTKIDMCDMNETKKWIKYYEQKGYVVVSLDLLNGKDVSKIINITKEILKPLDEKRKDKGLLHRSYRALVIGIPNVGKSTLINRLVGKKAVNVGNMPGITKNLNWIRINNDIELLDSPGILWPKLDNKEIALNLASTAAIKEEILPIDDVATHILRKLNDYYPDKLYSRYGLEHIDDIVEAFDFIGKKRGCLIRGGEIDYKKVSMLIIRDTKEGNIGNITLDRFKE
jgi:ribosome biogenesis GTPase A